MPYNFITNINGCIESATQLMYGNLNLVYYSHIPVAIIALLIGFFVIFKNKKDLSARVMFFLSMIFTLWVISSLVSWISSSSIQVSFFWSLFGLLNSMLFFSCIYLLYVYKNDKDMPIWFKIILGLLVLPVIFMTPTNFNVGDFNYSECYPVDNLFLGYMVYLEIIATLMMIAVAIRRYLTIEKQKRHEIVLVSLAIAMFLLSIFGTSYVSDKFQRYDIEVYGVFAMPLFLGFLAYLIVKFKAFDIKLIGAQALVWALVILIGSQFLFVTTLTNQILVGVTLVISGILGLILVRSVKKEVAQKEELEVANNNQQLLIRFITHQVKGFFTKSKMVFAGILEGDYGEPSEPLRNIVNQGLESDNKAVEMVQEVLNASSLRSGQISYNFEEVDIVPFIRDIAEGFKDVAMKRGLNYVIDLPQEIIKVEVDKLQITQVIKNLIDNSVKYTTVGDVKVGLKTRMSFNHETKKEVPTMLFSVKDTGVGLSDSDKERLFKEGGRGEESLKVNVNSTGYGLFIVKKIVEGHDGRIWAESQGRGHGSTFYVEIPRL